MRGFFARSTMRWLCGGLRSAILAGKGAKTVDCTKIGALLLRLRKERGLTQKQVADRLMLSDRTISKWERGQGCPDVSLLPGLSRLFGVEAGRLLEGEIKENAPVGGNMKNDLYDVCPNCGNLVLATGQAEVSCCGRKLAPRRPRKAAEGEKLCVEQVEDEWYVTGPHPMTKEDYISFVALVQGERLVLVKCYPEWDLQVRLPARRGMLVWYSTSAGLLYQLV